jgi:hypothetical protein
MDIAAHGLWLFDSIEVAGLGGTDGTVIVRGKGKRWHPQDSRWIAEDFTVPCKSQTAVLQAVSEMSSHSSWVFRP